MTRSRLILSLLLGLLFLIAVGVFGGYGIYAAVQSGNLEEVHAHMREQGIPVTPEDIIPPPVADDRNAAPILNEMIAVMDAHEEELADLTDLGAVVTDDPPRTEQTDPADLTAEERDDIRQRLAEPPCSEIMQLLEQAAAKPECRFDLDWDEGPGLLLPHVGPLRNSVRLLALSSWLAAEQGDMTGALDRLRTTVSIANHLEDEPILISQLVRLACLQATVNCMQRIVLDFPAPELPEPASRELRHALAASVATIEPATVRAVDGERILLGGWVYERALEGDLKTIQGLAGHGAGDDNPAGRVWAAVFLKMVTPLIKADYVYYLQSMLRQRDLRHSDNMDEEPPPRYYLLSSLLLPALGKVGEKAFECQAALQLAAVGMHIEQYRAQHDRLPPELAVLGLDQELLRDPFAAGQLQYKPEGDPLPVVYSIGAGKIDHGGIGWEEEPSSQSPHTPGPAPAYQRYLERDIVWQIPKRQPTQAE